MKKFKRLIALMLIVTLSSLVLIGCGNKTSFLDTTYTFNRAIMKLPDGTVLDVNIREWTDYGDGEQIQIKTEDGIIYLTNSMNCTLIKDK